MSSFQGGRGQSKGSLSKKEFADWEKAHREKMGGLKSAEVRTEERVRTCLALAVKGACVMILGLGGVFLWPFLFTGDKPTDAPHLMLLIPSSLIALVGFIILVIAAVKFLSSREGQS